MQILYAEAANGRDYFTVPMYRHAHVDSDEPCDVPNAIWAAKQSRTKHYIDCHRSLRHEIPKTRAGIVWACLRLDLDRKQPIRFHESSTRPYECEIKKVLEGTSTASTPEHTGSPSRLQHGPAEKPVVRSEQRTARAAQTLCRLQDPPHPSAGYVTEPHNIQLAEGEGHVTSPERSFKVNKCIDQDIVGRAVSSVNNAGAGGRVSYRASTRGDSQTSTRDGTGFCSETPTSG